MGTAITQRYFPPPGFNATLMSISSAVSTVSIQTHTVMQVSIRFAGNTIIKQVPSTTTVGQLINDANVKAVLGYSNVEAQVESVVQDSNALLRDGDLVNLVTKSNGKAV